MRTRAQSILALGLAVGFSCLTCQTEASNHNNAQPITFGGPQGWSGAVATANGTTVNFSTLNKNGASGVNLYKVTPATSCKELVVTSPNSANLVQPEQKFFKIDEQSKQDAPDDNKPPKNNVHFADEQFTTIGPGPFFIPLTNFDQSHPIHKLTLVFWKATIKDGQTLSLNLACR